MTPIICATGQNLTIHDWAMTLIGSIGENIEEHMVRMKLKQSEENKLQEITMFLHAQIEKQSHDIANLEKNKKLLEFENNQLKKDKESSLKKAIDKESTRLLQSVQKALDQNLSETHDQIQNVEQAVLSLKAECKEFNTKTENNISPLTTKMEYSCTTLRDVHERVIDLKESTSPTSGKKCSCHLM